MDLRQRLQFAVQYASMLATQQGNATKVITLLCLMVIGELDTVARG